MTDWEKVELAVITAVVSAVVSLIVNRLHEPWLAGLHSRHWLAQERWRLKSATYSKLLEALAEESDIFQQWEDEEWARVAEEHAALEAPGKGKTIEELDLKDEPLVFEPPANVQRIRMLSVEVTRLAGTAELWLSKAALDAIHSMEQALNKLWAGQASLATYQDAVEAVEIARALLQKAAAEDLKLAIRD